MADLTTIQPGDLVQDREGKMWEVERVNEHGMAVRPMFLSRMPNKHISELRREHCEQIVWAWHMEGWNQCER